MLLLLVNTFYLYKLTGHWRENGFKIMSLLQELFKVVHVLYAYSLFLPIEDCVVKAIHHKKM